MNSHELLEGDILFLEGRGPSVLRRVVQHPARTAVCNLTVEELHTFAVGKIQALVHNFSGTPGDAAPNAKPPRIEGPKPNYTVNPAHVPGTLRKGKTPLPADAEDVFRHAVPDDPVNPRNWFGQNADGQIYRFSGGNDGTAHFSGIDGVGDGIRNLTKYARQRLKEMSQ